MELYGIIKRIDKGVALRRTHQYKAKYSTQSAALGVEVPGRELMVPIWIVQGIDAKFPPLQLDWFCDRYIENKTFS